MKQLIPLQVDENTTIYIEPSDKLIQTPSPVTATSSTEVTRGDLGLQPKGLIEDTARRTIQSFQAIQNTIKAYTQGTINAFQDLGNANVDKVTLEFGINVGGEAGVPYVANGTAECDLKITVECSFPAEKTG